MGRLKGEAVMVTDESILLFSFVFDRRARSEVEEELIWFSCVCGEILSLVLSSLFLVESLRISFAQIDLDSKSQSSLSRHQNSMSSN